MAQYLSPFPTNKKKVIFRRRERDLKNAIKNNYSTEKLNKIAEKLRDSKLNLLKAKRHSVESYGEEKEMDRNSIKKIEKEVERWTSISTENLIIKYTKH